MQKPLPCDFVPGEQKNWITPVTLRERLLLDDVFIGLGTSKERPVLRLGRANRREMAAGITGTGALQGVAAMVSARRVPMFLAT